MRTYAHSSLLIALLVLTACGGSDPNNPSNNNGSAGGEAEYDGPPPDASRPATSVAILRTGPLGAVLSAFIPEGLPLSAETMPLEELTGGDTALAEHIDRARGVQVLFGVEGPVAVSIGVTGTLPESSLTNGTPGELVAGAHWALHRSPDENGAGTSYHCVATPAADGERLVCGDDRAKVARAAPYMAQTLAGSAVEGAQVRVEALLDAPMFQEVREELPGKIAELISAIETKLRENTTGVLANADVQREVLATVRGIADAVRSLFVDAHEAELVLSARDGNYVFESRAQYQTITSEWLLALVSALRTPAGWPTDLFARLPPDGVTYALGTSDARELVAVMTQLKTLMDAFLNATTALPAADRDALRVALDALITPEVALTASASSMGVNPWNVVLARTIEGASPADRIARMRALRTALARRPIAAALEAALTVSGRPLFQMREVRDMTAREVPAGGYGFRFKVHAPVALATNSDGETAPCGTPLECGLRQIAPTADQTYEVVLAPIGTDFMLAFGRQTRTLVTAVQQSTGPGVTAGQPAMAEAIILPGRMMARVSEQIGGPAVNVGGGDLPIVLRIEPAGAGPGGVLDIDLSIPIVFVKSMIMMGMGAAQALTAEPDAAPATEASPD